MIMMQQLTHTRLWGTEQALQHTETLPPAMCQSQAEHSLKLVVIICRDTASAKSVTLGLQNGLAGSIKRPWFAVNIDLDSATEKSTSYKQQ